MKERKEVLNVEMELETYTDSDDPVNMETETGVT